MITKSRVTNDWALVIFENFRVDTRLPKHYVEPDENDPQTGGFSIGVPSVTWADSSGDDVGRMIDNAWARGAMQRFRSVWWRIRHPRTKFRPTEFKYGKGDPLQIFTEVRTDANEFKEYSDRQAVFKRTMDQAKRTGQTALLERMKQAQEVVGFESILYAVSVCTYLTEPQVLEFAAKCQKGLALTWLQNFARPIPPDVAAKKEELDAIKVFDNYVVMHWDPEAKAFAMTEEDKERKRDPILFGVVKDVRKLYFIADWKDAEDDLTMEVVADVLGEPSTILEDPTLEP